MLDNIYTFDSSTSCRITPLSIHQPTLPKVFSHASFHSLLKGEHLNILHTLILEPLTKDYCHMLISKATPDLSHIYMLSRKTDIQIKLHVTLYMNFEKMNLVKAESKPICAPYKWRTWISILHEQVELDQTTPGHRCNLTLIMQILHLQTIWLNLCLCTHLLKTK